MADAIENGHRNSGFTHWKWWFSIVFCMFTRGYPLLSASLLKQSKRSQRSAYLSREIASAPLKQRLGGKKMRISWGKSSGYGSIPIDTIFSGMNIHLPAILMFTRGTRFWHTAIYKCMEIADFTWFHPSQPTGGWIWDGFLAISPIDRSEENPDW